LTERAGPAGTENISNAIQNLAATLGTSVADMHATVSSMHKRLQAVETTLSIMNHNVQQLAQKLAQQIADERLSNVQESALPVGLEGSGTKRARLSSSSPAVDTSVSCGSIPEPALSSGRPAAPAKDLGLGLLCCSGTPKGPGISLAGLWASDLWEKQMSGSLIYNSDSDSSRAKLVKTWWDAMATEEEKTLFKPPASGGPSADTPNLCTQKRGIKTNLNSLVVEFLKDAFFRSGGPVPSKLQDPENKMLAGSLETRLGELSRAPNALKQLEATPSVFQEFRHALEVRKSRKSDFFLGSGI
jgi:hypothetical protein